MSLRHLLRRLDRFRRAHTQVLAKWAYRILGNSPHLVEQRLDHSQIKKILVVRNNKRIGNMYFLLPFLREVRHCYPNAQVDLMVIEPGQRDIFLNLGLHQILVSHFAFVSLWPFLKTVTKARRTVYDLLLMPHSSASDTLICAFLNARNKVAFWGPTTQGVFRHALKRPPESHHAALSALTLLSELGNTLGQTSYTITFTAQEQTHAREIVAPLKGSASLCFAYFRGARGNKIIDDRTWREIRKKFDDATHGSMRWVEILSPDITSPLVPATATYQSSNLRVLGSVLKEMDLFICADTGPLHLADAANARCVGLYTATSPLHYGCLNEKSFNITDVQNLNAEEIVSKINPLPDKPAPPSGHLS